MTMEIQAKMYPLTDEETMKSRQALEHFRHVLGGMGVNVQHTLPVTVAVEPNPHWPSRERVVVKIEGHIHFNDGHTFSFGFGAAIAALKSGKKVARTGWNGKGMWIVLMPALKLPPFSSQEPGAKVNDRTAKHIGVDTPLDSQPYIAMWTAQGQWQPGWLASQADMLAEDWMVVE